VVQECMAAHWQKRKTTKQHLLSEQRLASDSQHSTSRQSSMQWMSQKITVVDGWIIFWLHNAHL